MKAVNACCGMGLDVTGNFWTAPYELGFLVYGKVVTVVAQEHLLLFHSHEYVFLLGIWFLKSGNTPRESHTSLHISCILLLCPVSFCYSSVVVTESQKGLFKGGKKGFI